jgi:hypothetical protein
VSQNMCQWVNLCLQENGGHFQHLLWRPQGRCKDIRMNHKETNCADEAVSGLCSMTNSGVGNTEPPSSISVEFTVAFWTLHISKWYTSFWRNLLPPYFTVGARRQQPTNISNLYHFVWCKTQKCLQWIHTRVIIQILFQKVHLCL